MQMQILKTIVTVGLLCSSNLLADAVVPTPQEYQEIVDSFKLIDTSKRELSQIYKINGEKVNECIKNLNHTDLPDPIQEEICELEKQIKQLSKRIKCEVCAKKEKDEKEEN